MSDTEEKNISELEQVAKTFSRSKEFTELMTYYNCAIMEIETKLRVLDAEFSLQYDRNPFESIETRLKNPLSIVEKMKSRGIEMTCEAMERQIFDIAGIRVICSFKEDIYKLSDLLIRQDDVLLISRKDYIEKPKPNGYRSLHMLLDIPIFLAEGKRHMKVEVQFRTIAMDFWASVDHKLRYKKHLKSSEDIMEKLRLCAGTLADMDDEMENIRRSIDFES